MITTNIINLTIIQVLLYSQQSLEKTHTKLWK